MDVAVLARMGIDALHSDDVLKGFAIMDTTRRVFTAMDPTDANAVKAALAPDERMALIDAYEDRDAPEQHARGAILALPRGAAAVARHKAQRKYGRRDREVVVADAATSAQGQDGNDSFSGSESFTSSGADECDEAQDLGGEFGAHARRHRPDLYRNLDQTVEGTLAFDLMCLDYILPTPTMDFDVDIDVPPPQPEPKKIELVDGVEMEVEEDDTPVYLLPEHQHQPPRFLQNAAPHRLPSNIAGT